MKNIFNFILPLIISGSLMLGINLIAFATEEGDKVKDISTKFYEKVSATLAYIPPTTINIDSKKCSKDLSYRRISEARMRFYAFYKMMHPYSQKKAYGYDASTYYHTSPEPLDVNYVHLLNSFLSEKNKWEKLLATDKFPFTPLIKELLNYYNKITSTKEWRDKLQMLAQQDLRPQIDTSLWPFLELDYGKAFHSLGFPTPENDCFMLPVSMDYDIGNIEEGIQMGSRYFDKESNLELWLYSFWLRRYVDGSMEKVHTILEWADNIVDESFFRTHKQATAFSADIKPNIHDDKLESLYKTFIVGEVSWKKTGKSTYVNDALRVPLPYKYTMKRQYIGTRDVAIQVLYPLSYQDGCSAHLQKTEIMADSNGRDVTYLKYLINGGKGCKGISYFASIAPLSELSKRLYKPAKVTESEMKLIHAELNSSLTFSQLQAYSKGANKVFVAYNRDVFSLDENGNIHNIWIPKGFHRISLDRTFIADLDDDGKIELLLNEASGLSGDVTINEVDESRRDLLVKISSWSEGEGQPSYYHDYSSKLLTLAN